MAVRIRLKRVGRRHVSTYRICVADIHTPRDGRVIEEIGTYAPTAPTPELQMTVKKDRAAYWLSVGAQPSETVRSLLKKAGVAIPVKTRKSKKKRAASPSKAE